MNDNINEQEPEALPAEISQDSRNLALLGWVGTIFFYFVPSLVLYLIKKDDEYVMDQAKEALNWSITVLIASVAAFILSFIVIGILMFPVIGIVNLVFCIMGAVGASKGQPFRVPFSLRLLK